MKLKDTVFTLFFVVFVASVITLSLNTVGNIIYALYLWGHNGLALGASLWEAALNWLVVGVTSVIIAIISFFGMGVTK